MDDVVNRMARELSDAIAAAVAEDPRIEACRERARAAGFEMKVSLEAVIGFMNRTTPGALAKIGRRRRRPRGRPSAATSNQRERQAASCARCGSPPTKRRKRKSNNSFAAPSGGRSKTDSHGPPGIAGRPVAFSGSDFTTRAGCCPVISGESGIPSRSRIVGATSRSEPSAQTPSHELVAQRTTGTGFDVCAVCGAFSSSSHICSALP